MHNGVDITDLTRNFSNDEWRKLSPEVMQQVRDAREAGKAAGAKKRNVAAVTAEPEEETGDKPEEEQQETVASNGTGFGSGAYSTSKRRAPNRRS